MGWVPVCVKRARSENPLGGSDLGAFLSRNGRTGEAVGGRIAVFSGFPGLQRTESGDEATVCADGSQGKRSRMRRMRLGKQRTRCEKQ